MYTSVVASKRLTLMHCLSPFVAALLTEVGNVEFVLPSSVAAAVVIGSGGFYSLPAEYGFWCYDPVVIHNSVQVLCGLKHSVL